MAEIVTVIFTRFLPATRHKWTRPALTPASKLVLGLPTPEGWKTPNLLGECQSISYSNSDIYFDIYFARLPFR